MIRYVYSFRHEVAEYFLKPEINDANPDQVVESVKRDAIRSAAQYAKAGMQDCSFYLLGTFDDKEGVFVSEPKILIPQSEIFAAVQKGIGYVESTAGKAPAKN